MSVSCALFIIGTGHLAILDYKESEGENLTVSLSSISSVSVDAYQAQYPVVSLGSCCGHGNF